MSREPRLPVWPVKPDCQPAPCKQCPFRRASMPGWLGDATPENFIASTLADYPMPCHTTVKYTDPNWKEKWTRLAVDGGPPSKMKFCAGAATFFANIVKRSRDLSRSILPADRELVFATPAEFIAHHRSRGRGSWEYATRRDEEATDP